MVAITQAISILSLACTALACNGINRSLTCRGGNSKRDTPTEGEPTGGKDWSYTGANGPEFWASINPAYALCDNGTEQSPINIATSKATSGADFVLSIPDVTSATLVNLGTTVEVPITGTFTHGGVTYTISQFHFHTPADHSLDGEFEVMEVHFVGADVNGAFSVAGFPIKVGNGTSNELFTNVFANAGSIPNSGDETTTGSLDFDAVANSLKTNELFEYAGSLTTPPCTEGVDWVVSTTPLTISEESMVLADSAIGFNARPVQNTNVAHVA